MSQIKDLVVLELASVLAGPGVGQFFAELGARVIKVENLRTAGDVTRTWKSSDENTDDRSAYFCSVNWGKQSIAVDLTRKEGQDIVQRLSDRSHIVIASYKPGDAAKLGVDYETLTARNPGLIYGQITGYGPRDERVGFDAIIQAEAGFMSMNGEPGGTSLKMPVALMDVLAGHHLKEGILLALLEKQATGRGRLVEVSLIEAAVASLVNQGTNFLVAGKTPGKQGSAHPNIAPYGDVFLTADGKELMLAVGTDKQFQALTELLGIQSEVLTLGISDNVSRVRNRQKLTEILQRSIGGLPADDLVSQLKIRKIPAGIVRTIPQALNDPQVGHMLIIGDEFRGIRSVSPETASICSHLLPPPHLGEHTILLLQEMLKISPTEAENLLRQRIIG